MTTQAHLKAHLKEEEFVDAIDGVLPAGRREHLDACAQCREELDAFQALAGDVAASGAVPEPSPLYWSHMADRVHAATAEIEPARAFPWNLNWRWVGGVAMAAAAVVLAVVVQRQPTPQSSIALKDVSTPARAAATDQPIGATAAGDPAGEESFAFVAGLAAGIEYEALREVAQPTPEAVDAMVAQLTDAERVEFVRLLKAETGSLE